MRLVSEPKMQRSTAAPGGSGLREAFGEKIHRDGGHEVSDQDDIAHRGKGTEEEDHRRNEEFRLRRQQHRRRECLPAPAMAGQGASLPRLGNATSAISSYAQALQRLPQATRRCAEYADMTATRPRIRAPKTRPVSCRVVLRLG